MHEVIELDRVQRDNFLNETIYSYDWIDDGQKRGWVPKFVQTGYEYMLRRFSPRALGVTVTRRNPFFPDHRDYTVIITDGYQLIHFNMTNNDVLRFYNFLNNYRFDSREDIVVNFDSVFGPKNITIPHRALKYLKEAMEATYLDVNKTPNPSKQKSA